MEQEPHIPIELTQYVDQRVRNALGRYRQQAVIGFVILLLGLGAGVAVEREHNSTQRDQIEQKSAEAQRAIVTSGDAIAVSGCNRDYETIDALRDQLERSLLRIDQLEKAGTYTHAQAQAGRDSTFEFLQRYKLPDCRNADDVLTANPGEAIVVPLARYPNDPLQKADEANEADELGKKSDVP